MLSNGSGTSSKARGAQQVGRRRSRGSEEERSLSERSTAEEEVKDDPSAKKSVHGLQLLQHPYISFVMKRKAVSLTQLQCCLHSRAIALLLNKKGTVMLSNGGTMLL